MNSDIAPTGQESPIALIASPLLITSHCQPLPDFLQRSADGHFYLAKYDGEKTLTALKARLLNDKRLPNLQVQLIEVARKPMLPALVSLWLVRPFSNLRTYEALARRRAQWRKRPHE